MTLLKIPPWPLPCPPEALATTADACDALGEAAQIVPLDWQDYGATHCAAGVVVTVSVPDDNSLVRAQLETAGEGRVLLVCNGGRSGVAMVGGALGQLAVRHGWAGIVVHGRVRDAGELRHLPIMIKALGTVPRKSDKRGLGTVGVDITLAGLTIRPGDWLLADQDGLVLLSRP